MAKRIYTHDQLPETCEPIEVDEDGRTVKLEYLGFIFTKGSEYPLWKISKADGKRVHEALEGKFTSVTQCIVAVQAVVNL